MAKVAIGARTRVRSGPPGSGSRPGEGESRFRGGPSGRQERQQGEGERGKSSWAGTGWCAPHLSNQHLAGYQRQPGQAEGENGKPDPRFPVEPLHGARPPAGRSRLRGPLPEQSSVAIGLTLTLERSDLRRPLWGAREALFEFLHECRIRERVFRVKRERGGVVEKIPKRRI